MEKVAWLFNSDFEKNLFEGKYNEFNSSKKNQEFEYFIHLVNPEETIFSTKQYTKDFTAQIESLTNHKFKVSSDSAQIRNWCQEYNQLELLKKIQSKFKTHEFLVQSNLQKNEAKFIKNIKDIEPGYVYKIENGFSGSGHFLFPEDKNKITKHLENSLLLKEKLRVRERDFSTLIEDNKVIAQYENYIDQRFQYKGSYFTAESFLTSTQQEEYNLAVELALNYCHEYKGVLSLDSYLSDGELIPICEFNARKTMGYVAYHIWKRYFTNYSHFKFLIFKNNQSEKVISNPQIVKLSPKENIFSVFVLGSHSKTEMVELEKELSAALL